MKRLAILSLLVLFSCSRVETPVNKVVLDASGACCVKAGLNDMSSVWHSSDMLSVFYQGGSQNLCAEYVGENMASRGNFTFSLDQLQFGGKTVALYPYRSSNSLSGTSVSTEISVNQNYVEGSYDSASPLLLAVSDNNQLSFRYACAVVAVEMGSLPGTPLSVTDIRMRSRAGEFLAGKLSVELGDYPALSMAVTEGSTEIRMDCSASPVSLGGAKPVFYFCVVPGLYSDGYEFSVTLSDGTVKTVRCSGNVELLAGKIYPVQAYVTDRVRIVMEFSDKTAFTPGLPQKATKTPANGTVHLFTDPVSGKKYSFTAYSPSGGYFLKLVNSVTCLRFNSPGDAMLLPVIENRRLVEFGATLQQSANKSFTLSSTIESIGDIMPSTTFRPNEMKYVSVITLPGQKVYMNMVTNNMQISRLELEYE